MHRNKGNVGIFIVALFICSALSAQASASPLTVNEGASGSTFYTGDQDGGVDSLQTPNGSVSCTGDSVGATTTGATVNEITITPTFGTCKAFGFATAHIKGNNCTYTLTTPTQISSNEVTWHASGLHITCPAGKTIEVTPTSFGVSVCTLFINEQTPTGGHIIGKNAGSSGANTMDVTLEFTLTGIHYTGTGGVCSNSETHTDASFSGSTTVRGFSNEARTTQRGITFV